VHTHAHTPVSAGVSVLFDSTQSAGLAGQCAGCRPPRRAFTDVAGNPAGLLYHVHAGGLCASVFALHFPNTNQDYVEVYVYAFSASPL
jgi:hypothetical protein